jgi:hypothetical protein
MVLCITEKNGNFIVGCSYMATTKYNNLSPTAKCMVDAEIAEENGQAERLGIRSLDDPRFTDIRKEGLSDAEMIKQMEGYAQEGKAPWAKCLLKP